MFYRLQFKRVLNEKELEMIASQREITQQEILHKNIKTVYTRISDVVERVGKNVSALSCKTNKNICKSPPNTTLKRGKKMGSRDHRLQIGRILKCVVAFKTGYHFIWLFYFNYHEHHTLIHWN